MITIGMRTPLADITQGKAHSNFPCSVPWISSIDPIVHRRIDKMWGPCPHFSIKKGGGLLFPLTINPYYQSGTWPYVPSLLALSNHLSLALICVALCFQFFFLLNWWQWQSSDVGSDDTIRYHCWKNFGRKNWHQYTNFGQSSDDTTQFLIHFC